MNTVELKRTNLQIFKTYLKSKSYSPRTIKDDLLNVDRFLKWYRQTNEEDQARLPVASVVELTVPELVEYINVMQAQNITPQTINLRLRSIRKYYAYLKSEGYFVSNLESVKVKGAVKKIVVDPLDYSDLEQLYSNYSNYRKTRLETHNKNFHNYKQASLSRKVMVGFMVFQGLRSGDLKRLEIDHINEEDGTIYIPATRRSKARQLKLQSNQMRPLFKHLDALLVKQASLLFSNDVDNQLFQLLQELRGLNHKVQDATHIRASVIMHWLKLHGKRQTQYMIGHKWISSTEHYELQDLEALTNLLGKYHPLANAR